MTAADSAETPPGQTSPPPPTAAEAPLQHLYSGKVREVYQLPGGPLLLVATDRISAYDYVLPTLIPDKGKILTQLSLWWFGRLADLVPNHLVDAPIPAEFAGRAMACRSRTAWLSRGRSVGNLVACTAFCPTVSASKDRHGKRSCSRAIRTSR